jgi:hypothetical protein
VPHIPSRVKIGRLEIPPISAHHVRLPVIRPGGEDVAGEPLIRQHLCHFGQLHEKLAPSYK